MQNEIVQRENSVLRKVAREVPIEEIQSRKINTVIRRMAKALNQQEDGVAIAAPQIGESLRIFIVSRKAFALMAGEESSESFEDMVFINPIIVKTSKKKQLADEGCLSIRWLYGKVERPAKTLVKAYSQEGKPFTMGGSGLLSQIFNHEIEHLDGILFTDKAKGLKEIPPSKN